LSKPSKSSRGGEARVEKMILTPDYRALQEAMEAKWVVGQNKVAYLFGQKSSALYSFKKITYQEKNQKKPGKTNKEK
jgi:hypothetical protein